MGLASASTSFTGVRDRGTAVGGEGDGFHTFSSPPDSPGKGGHMSSLRTSSLSFVRPHIQPLSQASPDIEMGAGRSHGWGYEEVQATHPTSDMALFRRTSSHPSLATVIELLPAQNRRVSVEEGAGGASVPWNPSANAVAGPGALQGPGGAPTAPSRFARLSTGSSPAPIANDDRAADLMASPVTSPTAATTAEKGGAQSPRTLTRGGGSSSIARRAINRAMLLSLPLDEDLPPSATPPESFQAPVPPLATPPPASQGDVSHYSPGGGRLRSIASPATGGSSAASKRRALLNQPLSDSD